MPTKTANLRIAATDGPDFYPTPAWAIRGLLKFEQFEGSIHEPCCGAGHMADALKKAGYCVTASDLFDYGYGTSGMDARNLFGEVDNIVTNPPYNLATELILHFVNVAKRKVGLLTRMAFLESKRRFAIFNEKPPASIYVFSERLSMAPANQVVNGGGTVSHCWIVWDKHHTGSPTLKWIPPGFKTHGLL